MFYDVFIFLLAVGGAVGAVIFSLKIAHSPVRRVGVIRELPSADGVDNKLRRPLRQRKVLGFEEHLDKLLTEKGDAQLPLTKSRGTSYATFSPEVVLHHYLDLEHKPELCGAISSQDIVGLGEHLNFECKRVVYTAFDSSLIVQSVERGATQDLQTKVDDLNDRLKKVESELLRKLQESRNNESKEQTEYLQ